MARSRGELKVEDILVDAGIPFETEYIFSDLRTKSGRPLRFDFAIFDDDDNVIALIEYQGEQHYESATLFGGSKGLRKQKYNDSRKRTYCARNRLKLIEIPYWEYQDVNYDYLYYKIYE